MRTLSITVFFSETSLRNTVFQINSYSFPVSRFIHNFIHKHKPMKTLTNMSNMNFTYEGHFK